MAVLFCVCASGQRQVVDDQGLEFFFFLNTTRVAVSCPRPFSVCRVGQTFSQCFTAEWNEEAGRCVCTAARFTQKTSVSLDAVLMSCQTSNEEHFTSFLLTDKLKSANSLERAYANFRRRILNGHE